MMNNNMIYANNHINELCDFCYANFGFTFCYRRVGRTFEAGRAKQAMMFLSTKNMLEFSVKPPTNQHEYCFALIQPCVAIYRIKGLKSIF